MKRSIFIPLMAMILVACNDKHNEASDHQTHEMASMSANSSTEKAKFAKVENLPTGIEQAFGKMPSKEKGYFKFSFPRQDFNVALQSVKIDARFAFTSWFGFMPGKDTNQTMLMGDMVLLETEFPAVLKRVNEMGFDITGIHNHLLDEKPKIMYMHISATGNPLDLSNKLKNVLSVTATPMKASYTDTAHTMDWGKTEEVLGCKGKKEGSIIKFSITRKEKITDRDMELPDELGVNSVINFQRIGDKAAVTGDFVLVADEVNKVAKILTANNITVTALHNHMLYEKPRLFFMHFWAVDNPETLAKGLHEVIANTNHEAAKQ